MVFSLRNIDVHDIWTMENKENVCMMVSAMPTPWDIVGFHEPERSFRYSNRSIFRAVLLSGVHRTMVVLGRSRRTVVVDVALAALGLFSTRFHNFR